VDVNEPTDTSYLKLPPNGVCNHLLNNLFMTNSLIKNCKHDPTGRFVLRKGELCRIKTGLFSTKFTQNSMSSTIQSTVCLSNNRWFAGIVELEWLRRQSPRDSQKIHVCGRR
jgi:hypothetical protein